MAVPAAPTFGTNGNVPSSTLSALVLLALFARDPTAVIVSRSAALSVASASFTDVPYDVENADNDGGFAATSAVVTIQNSGYFVSAAGGLWAGNATGTRAIRLNLNGTDIPGSVIEGPPNGATQIGQLSVGFFVAAVGDSLKFNVFQNSGGSLNWSGARLGVVRISGPRT